MSKAAAEFEKAWRALPDCVDLDLLAMTTIEDLVAAAEIRLDRTLRKPSRPSSARWCWK